MLVYPIDVTQSASPLVAFLPGLVCEPGLRVRKTRDVVR